MTRGEIAALNGLAPTGDCEFEEPRYVDAVGSLALAVAMTHPRRQPRRARVRMGTRFAIALAVLALFPAASAIAYQLSAHTGLFGSPGQTENDTSEWLRSDAPDFGAMIAALVPDHPLPAGATWRQAVTDVVRQGRNAPGLIQVTGIRLDFESYARCAWMQSWLLASDRHDDVSMRRAAVAIDKSTHWPLTVASDGGGVVEHLRAVARAARRGDRLPLQQGLAINCTGFDLEAVH
jgi:hypothetical protein